MVPLQYIFFSLCVVFTMSVIGEELIKLPGKLPVLSETDINRLGTNEANIGVKTGHQLADFKLITHLGETISFASLLNNEDLLVVFYRGGWCPYCNVQIRQLTIAFPEFEKRNILPVLISADKPDGAILAKESYQIPFPVLSDANLNAHQAFDVVFQLDNKMVDIYRQYGIILEDWSGKGHHKFAVASVFIVSPKGIIKWAHTSTDYKVRPSISQLLKVIDEL